MRKLKEHKNRLRTNHKRYPWSIVMKDEGKNAVCKYCGRTPLVDGFDMNRTLDEKEQFACLECYQVGRTSEDKMTSLGRLGMALAGLREDEEFPLEPEKNTPRKIESQNCASCGKMTYCDPYKKKLIGAHNELLRGIRLHDNCPLP